MLLIRMETPNKGESSWTTRITDEFGVKIMASLSGMATASVENASPITSEIIKLTLAANLASLTFPAPNSMATRTLHNNKQTLET